MESDYYKVLKSQTIRSLCYYIFGQKYHSVVRRILHDDDNESAMEALQNRILNSITAAYLDAEAVMKRHKKALKVKELKNKMGTSFDTTGEASDSDSD